MKANVTFAFSVAVLALATAIPVEQFPPPQPAGQVGSRPPRNAAKGATALCCAPVITAVPSSGI
jgi:hypothetical protein